MIKTENLRIRDPFVVKAGDLYYMYRSSGNSTICVHKSRDLSEWSEGTVVYKLAENSWGVADLWAPEVHLYKGKYYMFLSLLGKNGLRGTEISVSDTPDGLFTPLTNKPVTPESKSCIDGTLYVENGVPYIVYSSDWPHNYIPERDCYIGEIWATELTPDLTAPAGKPFLLFKSDEATCSALPCEEVWEGKQIRRYGSDAPFIQVLKDGTLYLTWSPIPNGNYIVAAAVSKNKSIKGHWEHLNEPLFANNGGHAMFFTAADGTKKMCLHCPERYLDERALFLTVIEENGCLRIV